MLLNTVKDVCGSLVGLLIHAKNANGQQLEHPAFEQVSDYSKGVIVNITNLLKSVKSFEDENTRGTRALESSIEAISLEIHEFDSSDNPKVLATPEDLIRANRAITQATSKAVFASNSGKQEDLLAAANIGRRAIADLLNNCKGAAFSCEDEEMKTQTLQHGHNLAAQYHHLLRQLLQSLTNPTQDSKAELMNISRQIAQTATMMAQVAEKLKGSDWVDPEDPMLIAENELLSAAEAIEQAAKNLAILRPRSEMPGQKISYEDMTFDELIIDSAKSIANATSSLIKAASEAQKELVAQGKVAKQIVKGSEDGQWSEGLVSAAKLVASATHSLCEAANKLVQGEGGEEHLIAAAKQVSKSTAQLVLACKVKADTDSSAMVGLKTASNAVRKATDALVKAAKGSIQEVPSPKVKVDRFKERIEAEARVIRLEKELREAKEVEEEVKEKSQRTVSDIKKARDAEAVVLSLAKELEEARNYCLRLNEEQYNQQ
jgi:talin